MDYLDITYSGIEFIIMSVVEPSLAVSLACVPLLRPLVARGDSRYSETGTRENRFSMSVRGLNNDNRVSSNSQVSDKSRRLMRGRSSCPSVPAHVLQYHYEIGKEGVELITTTGNEYQYQAEITGGHESDGASSSGVTNAVGAEDALEIRGGDGTNIVIKQEWIVLNEMRKLSDESPC